MSGGRGGTGAGTGKIGAGMAAANRRNYRGPQGRATSQQSFGEFGETPGGGQPTTPGTVGPGTVGGGKGPADPKQGGAGDPSGTPQLAGLPGRRRTRLARGGGLSNVSTGMATLG